MKRWSWAVGMVVLTMGMAMKVCAEEPITILPDQAWVEDSWEESYLWILEELGENPAQKEMYSFALIYVNEDEIPELVCYSGAEAGGCQIYTWQDGATDLLQTHRLGYTYMERGNRLRNHDGINGFIFDNIYEIRDGQWVELAQGGYSVDGWSEFGWTWNGQEISGESYASYLGQIYDTESEIETERYYIYEEMYSLLSKGETLSATHSYEIIRGDVSWYQAAAACQSRGGYLAAITSPEELETVTELVRMGGYEKCVLWVGGSRKDRFGYQWITPEGDLPMVFECFYPFWLQGEPSYVGLTEGGWEEEEEFVTMFYRSSEGRCVLNDVPDDILGAAPSYMGRIGYICEYE